MNEHESVRLTLRLPHDIAEQAKEVQKTDPEFLSRVVLYGLTRRSIYHQLRKAHADLVHDGLAHVFGEDGERIEPIPEEDQVGIRAEHEAVDSEAGVDEADG
jgi:hypothetical protein